MLKRSIGVTIIWAANLDIFECLVLLLHGLRFFICTFKLSLEEWAEVTDTIRSCLVNSVHRIYRRSHVTIDDLLCEVTCIATALFLRVAFLHQFKCLISWATLRINLARDPTWSLLRFLLRWAQAKVSRIFSWQSRMVDHRLTFWNINVSVGFFSYDYWLLPFILTVRLIFTCPVWNEGPHGHPSFFIYINYYK